MEVIFAFLCLITLFIINFWYRRRRFHEYCDKLPGVRHKSLLFYLHLLRQVYFKKRIVKSTTIILQSACAFHHIFRQHRIGLIWLAFRPVVLFFEPETVEPLLSSRNTIDKSREYNLLHPWIGTGLLTSTGEKWRSRRKLLTPSFHFRILEEFIPIFDEQSNILVRKLKDGVRMSHVDIAPLMTMCALDIICETAMGVKMHAQTGGCTDYVNALIEVQEAFTYRVMRPWLWLNKMFFCFPSGRKFFKNVSLLHGFTTKVIKEKKESLLKQQLRKNSHSDSDATPRKKAFLELLLENHLSDNSFTEEDIREEVDTFMFEGHDTTAMALSFTLYNVGLLPEVQENVIQEIDSIFGEDTERSVTTEDLRLMKYMECVIKESLRLYPSVPFIAREIKEDIKVLDYTIVPGMFCVICPFFLHRNPKIFDNPEKFDPERFFPENAAGRHPYAYIPFSAGPRNCIGQKFALLEEKTILANIFRHVRIKSLDHRDKVNLTPDIILKNADPLRIKIISRKGDKRV